MEPVNYSCPKHKVGYASWCEKCQDQYREWRAWKAEQGEDDCAPPVLLVPASSSPAGVSRGASPEPTATATTPPPFRGKYHKKFTEKPKPKRDRRSQDEKWKALEFEIDRLTRGTR